MKKKAFVLFIAFIFILSISVVSIIFYPFYYGSKKAFMDFSNKFTTEDGQKGWDYMNSKGPVNFVLTNFDFLNPIYTSVEGNDKYIRKFSSAYVYQFKRESIIDFTWEIERFSSNTIRKPYSDIVELAKTTDIGMINRKIIDYDNGDDCFELEEQPGMYNCRKSKDDEGYDPDISTYWKAIEDKMQKQFEELQKNPRHQEIAHGMPDIDEEELEKAEDDHDYMTEEEIDEMIEKLREDGYIN